MTEATIAAVLGRVLVREGGKEDVAADHGGYTNWGLTADFLETVTGESWTAQKISNLTRDQALGLYRKWLEQTHLDRLPDDVELADCVIDYAVNSGESRPIKALQKALGVTVDGELGPQTQAALTQCSLIYLAGLRRKVLAARIRFIGGDLHANPSQVTFANGWLNRLADQVEVL